MKVLGAGDPQSVGGYRLLSSLGAGGMGRVYLARSAGGRTVAVKVVHPELARQPEFRARFRREIEAARRVGGRWTAPVLDADPDAEAPWVATGYVAGPSLQEVIAGPDGPLPARSLLALANGLARALHDIHAAGLVHRDLKPANVLVTIDGPRVIDFGIARAAEPEEGAALTRTGVTVGSPGFMSPEQVHGERLTTASDVFSLGTVLAFAATGRCPFGDASIGVPGLLLRVVQGEKDLTGVPDGIRQLIEDCLAPSPADRPTPAELIERTAAGDLWHAGAEPWVPATLVARLGRHAVELLDSDAPSSTPLTTPLTTTVVRADAPPARRRVRLIAACSALAALLIGVGAWYVTGLGDDGEQQNAGGGAGATGEPGTSQATGSTGPSATETSPAALTAADVAGQWEGEAQRSGNSTTTYHRFELTDGEVGDRIGTVHAVFPNAVCAAEITLASTDGDHLTVTTDQLYSVPAGACTFTGRSTLSLSGSTLVWQDSGLTASLGRAADGGKAEAVPGDYLGEWALTDDSGNRHTVTIAQGRVTDSVVTWVRDGADGSRCTWKDTLFAVAESGEWLLFGTSSDTESTPSGTCEDGDLAAFRLYAPEDGKADAELLPKGTGTLRLTKSG